MPLLDAQRYLWPSLERQLHTRTEEHRVRISSPNGGGAKGILSTRRRLLLHDSASVRSRCRREVGPVGACLESTSLGVRARQARVGSDVSPIPGVCVSDRQDNVSSDIHSVATLS